MKKFTALLASALILSLCAYSNAQDQNGRGQRGERPRAQRGQGERPQGQRQRGQRPQAQRPQFERPNLKPTLFANLGDGAYTPDGMTIHTQTGQLYLNVPNFGRMNENPDKKKPDSAQGGYLFAVNKDGSFEKVLEFPILEKTGQTGPMGISCGPDGHLYVCDNQYFYNTDYCSRILRVVCKDGKPTGEIQVVIEGIKLANGMAWYGDKMFYTDSFFDIDSDEDAGIIGSGGVFMFTLDELSKAGFDGAPAIKIKAGPDEAHCVAYVKVQKLGRGDNTGADGICVDKNGVVWFGNFGNGFIYCLRPDENGAYKQENVETVFDALNQRAPERGPYAGVKLECCDGICYDPKLDRVFIDDSCNNAIWIFKPCEKGETIRPTIMWKNDDTDGMDGSLDQPCEAVVYGDKLVIVNFDWPFPGLLNSKLDAPGTLSAIDYAEIEKYVQFQDQFQRRGQGARGEGQGRRPNRGQN